MSKIKIGVLGCSSIAWRSVLPAMIKSDRFQLEYVASRNVEKGKSFANQFGCKSCNYTELIQSNNVDAIYLSLPVSLHYEWGKKVIQNRKHLLMEKPFTDSYIKSKEIIALAKKNKLIAMEGLVYVYHPLYEKVIALIENNVIGKVKHIDAYFGFPLMDGDNIRKKPKLGGGAILDTLIYPLSFALNIAGKEPHIITGVINYNKKYNIDERGSFLLDFGSVTANIVYGFGLMYRNSYCIWGEKGYLSDNRVFSRPPDMEGEILITKQNETTAIPVESSNQFFNMLNVFAEKITFKKNNNRINEGIDILNRMKIISNIYQNSKSHKKNIMFK